MQSARNWRNSAVFESQTSAQRDRRSQPAVCAPDMRITFWSADWSPWRALAAVGRRFPGLRFDLRPSYDEAL